MQNVNWVQGLTIGLPVSVGIVAVIVLFVLIIYFYQKNQPAKPPSISTNPQTLEIVQNVQGLYLPLQGSIKDPYVYVRNDPTQVTNLLVFRAQGTYETAQGQVPFNFPSEALVKQEQVTPGTILSAQNSLTNPNIGGLYNFNTATQQGFPWPPNASAQLLKYQNNPNVAPANDFNAQNPLLPEGPFKRQYPSLANAFVVASTLEGNTWGSSTAQNTVSKTESKIQTVILEFLDDGLVYVEVAGGSGGSFTTGNAGPVSIITQAGGPPGILWAYAKVSRGTRWNVQLSSSGGSLPASTDQAANEVAIKNQIVSRDSFSTGGGTGSFLAGSEGGGTTYVSDGPLQDPQSPDVSTSAIARNVLIMAGGGGGASKNAQGGPAGGSFIQTAKPVFNQPSENNNFNGQPGGSSNIINFAADDTSQTQLRNELSGGGGSASSLGFASRGGQSYTVSELASDTRTNDSFTSSEKQAIVDETTGTSLRGGSGTSNPPGGGGGGAGFAGGGAGTWNLYPAPQNQHGAGGGGSSQVSKDLFFRSTEGTPNANPQYIQGSEFVFNPTNYFLLGIPCQNETCT